MHFNLINYFKKPRRTQHINVINYQTKKNTHNLKQRNLQIESSSRETAWIRTESVCVTDVDRSGNQQFILASPVPTITHTHANTQRPWKYEWSQSNRADRLWGDKHLCIFIIYYIAIKVPHRAWLPRIIFLLIRLVYFAI